MHFFNRIYNIFLIRGPKIIEPYSTMERTKAQYQTFNQIGLENSQRFRLVKTNIRKCFVEDNRNMFTK